MRTETAIRTILNAMTDRFFVCANGHISRTAWAVGNRKRVFPMLGSMGLAPSIALGFALARSSRPVGVLNGDGNLLMEPTSSFLVGQLANLNFVHFCLNNQSYHSTGGQPTPAKPGLLADIARSSGYRRSVVIDRRKALAAFCAREFGSPNFCEVLVEADGEIFPRVEDDTGAIAHVVRRAHLEPEQ